MQIPPLFPSSQCQSLAKSCCSLWKGFRDPHTDHLLSLVLQMNRPIQVKPADSEGRGGRSSILQMHGMGRGAQGDMVASRGLLCEGWFAEESRKGSAFAGGIQIWVQSKCHLSLSLSGQLGGAS